ncbi:MAG: polysaccharide pyruvyl transferase family protein [Clostridia bacterium]|nr:polysaccharide pyruvyl transferase family protein [Clostridia bacterium]
MYKVGLLTFHASHNNGSMLQALALQTVLEKKYDCEVELINFSNAGQQNMYSVLPKPNNFKRLIKNIIWRTNIKQLRKQFSAYHKFSQRYFHLSKKKYKKAEELKNCEEEYDAIITGSDQVWNVCCLDADDAYYLNFVQNKPKFAYAVSFGANNPFETSGRGQDYVKYLESMDLISVREQNAKKWILKFAGIDVPLCLDPTMLYNKDEWEEIVDVGVAPIIKGEYIFYYSFGINERIQKFLKWVSKRYGLPVYFMEAKEWTLKACWRNKIRLIKSYGPDVYMNVVKHAKLFITTSFHGTAFATIYHKNFWYINDKQEKNPKDDRAVSFLTQLDLMERYRTIQDLKKTNLMENLDFSSADNALITLKSQSFSFIDNIINRIYEKQ